MNLEERYEAAAKRIALFYDLLTVSSDELLFAAKSVVDAWLSAGDTLYEHDGEARTSNGEYVSASEALQNAIEWGMCRVGKGDNE